jgi:hypothetical protein
MLTSLKLLAQSFLLIFTCWTWAAAVDVVVQNQTISTIKSYSGDTVTSRNNVISSTGKMRATINAGGQFKAEPLLTVQLGGRLVVKVPNQPPVVAYIATNANPVLTTSVTLTAIAADDGGLSNLTYTWSKPSNATWAAGNIGSTVTANFTQSGTYTFSVTTTDQGSKSASASLTVVVAQTPTSIAVSPNGTQTTNASQQFSVTTYDQFNIITANPSITWSKVSGSGTINSSGLFTATALGSYTVKAVAINVPSSSATVTLISGNHIEISPTAANVVVTESKQFTATLVNQFGVLVSPQPTFTYTMSDSYYGNISNTGFFTAQSHIGGPFTITASSSTYSNAFATVTLIRPPTVYLSFDLASPTLTLTPTDYALGSGWIKNIGGRLEMVPDTVNNTVSTGTGQLIRWFTKGALSLKSSYLTTTAYSRGIFAIPRLDLSYGYIKGPATQLDFQRDLSDVTPRDIYLHQVTYSEGTNTDAYTGLHAELKGYMPSISSSGSVSPRIANGYLEWKNEGVRNYTADNKGGIYMAGIVPAYTFTLTPTSNQTYTNVSHVAYWGRTASVLPLTLTPVTTPYLSISSNTGGQRFIISYSSYTQSRTTATVYSNDITIAYYMGLLFGSFTAAQIASN